MKWILRKSATLGIILMITIACVIMSYGKETILASSDIISNTKIEWGIKRAENHLQPDVGSTNTSLMEEYNGIYMGSNEQNYVYLTFDLGYEAGYTEQILDTLKDCDVTACFFITAHYVNSASEIVQRMIDDGHTIGNHTVNHKSLPELTEDKIKEEVMKLHTVIYEKFNYEMKYIRPPKGEYSEKVLATTNSLGYQTVMWSFAYDDWDEDNQGREDYAKEKILSNIHPGCVILLHATSKDNANILKEVIQEIENMGYEFKSLDEYV